MNKGGKRSAQEVTGPPAPKASPTGDSLVHLYLWSVTLVGAVPKSLSLLISSPNLRYNFQFFQDGGAL